jgi:hypothetical protein
MSVAFSPNHYDQGYRKWSHCAINTKSRGSKARLVQGHLRQIATSSDIKPGGGIIWGYSSFFSVEISVQRFSAQRFSLRKFTTEPSLQRFSLQNLPCRILIAEALLEQLSLKEEKSRNRQSWVS